MMKRVVITGCGIVSSVGIGKELFWDSLSKGKSGVGKITQFDASEYSSQIAGEVNDFVPPAFLSVKDV
ncbi:MAG: beta-ketoacyl-[acyl-carrier-protein] synthase II, partial [Candidatus Omnitrophica bacterium]|nr:beta-ketoacyl-[acyl-carrier-protein] synthase II [Candidatus Omnitrophota bacterium]